MPKLITAAGVALAGFVPFSAGAYSNVGVLTFSWGQSAVPAYTNSNTGFGAPAATSGAIKGWQSSSLFGDPPEVGGTNSLSVMTNATQLDALTGPANQWNSQSYLEC